VKRSAGETVGTGKHDGRPQPKPVEVLRRSCGLTRAEATVATLLAEAHTVTEVAALLGVSVFTVRAQVRSIYAKTGVNRQAALVRLLFRGEGADAGK